MSVQISIFISVLSMTSIFHQKNVRTMFILTFTAKKEIPFVYFFCVLIKSVSSRTIFSLILQTQISQILNLIRTHFRMETPPFLMTAPNSSLYRSAEKYNKLCSGWVKLTSFWMVCFRLFLYIIVNKSEFREE